MIAVISVVSLGVWLYLVAARGGFWRCAVRYPAGSARDLPAEESARQIWPRVVAIVPARNEAAVIADSLMSLLRQDYGGDFAVILVDDQSGDDTGRIALETAAEAGVAHRLTVVAGHDVPPHWAGKLWALQQGLDHLNARGETPDYILFTDADIAHGPHVLGRLAALAEERGTVLVSLMAKLRAKSLVERALVPAFIFFFQKLYPFAWVNDPGRGTAAAAGGCVLVAREAFERAGGLEPIRASIIDDCALARLMKREGPIFLALTEDVLSLRAYRSLPDFRRMVVRSAYAELDFSPWRLLGAVAGMALTYLAPPLIVVVDRGMPQFLALFALALMVLAFMPTLRFYGLSRLWALALPLIATVYVAFTIESALEHWRGRGGLWKGRFQAGSRALERKT